MANDIKGITIEFKGDTTSLGKALSSVNSQIRQTDSALRAVDKALKLDPDNVELIAQKEALLAKQIEQTKDKLNLQKQAAEAAAEALAEGTISTEEYAKLAAQVSTTASKLNDLENSASGASEEMAQTGDAIEEASDAAEGGGVSFEAFGAVVVGAAEAAVVAVTAIATAVAATTAALANATLQTSELADEILTMSSVTGVSTDTLQAMNYAAELVDVSTDTMTGSMTRLIRSMDSAQSGSQTAVDAFASLGVAVTDSNGELRDSEEVFWDAIDALGNIANETERDAAAMEIFGRSARELNPLIETGSEGFEALREEAQEAGYIMSGDTLDAFGALDDNMQRLNNGATAARNAIGGILLPILTDLSGEGVSLINDFTNALLDTDGNIEELGSVIDEMMPRIVSIIDEYLPVVLDLGSTIIGTLVTALLSNLGVILETAGSIIMTIMQGIIDHTGDLAPTISSLIVSLANFIVLNLPLIVSNGMQITLAVVEGITNSLDELIPACVDAIITICEALTDPDTLVQLILAAQTLMLKLAEGLILALPDLLAAVPEIGANLIEALLELAPQLVSTALSWGADMISGFIEGIQNALPDLASAVSNVSETIASYLHFSTPDQGALADMDEHGGRGLIENYIEGLEAGQSDLQTALYGTSQVIYNGMTAPDYSGALSGISTQLAGIGGGAPQVINLYVGSQKFATAVVNANSTENYRAGGI